jgi:urease accessory protein
LPPGESGLLYSIGFVMATGTLHACGIGIGEIRRWSGGRKALRVCGGVIALVGVYFLWEAIHPEVPEASPVPSAAPTRTPKM